MFLKFASFDLQSFLSNNANCVTITLKTTKLLIFEYGWGRRTSCQACNKPTRVQSCSMHAISRYCEIMPKIIDFILFVGSEKSL